MLFSPFRPKVTFRLYITFLNKSQKIKFHHFILKIVLMMSQGVNDLKMQFILQLSELVFFKLQF